MDRALISLLQTWELTWPEIVSVMMPHVGMLLVRKSSVATTMQEDALLLANDSEEEVYKIEMLMNQAGITVHDRPDC